MNMPDGYVSVIVHHSHLHAVHKLLGNLGAPSEDTSASTEPEPEAGFEEWTNARIDRLWKESSNGQKCVFLLLATSPVQPVSVETVNEFLTRYEYGGDNAPSRGVVGGIGRRCERRYGLPRPFVLGDHEHRRVYTLPETIGKRIKFLSENDAACNELLDQVSAFFRTQPE